MTDTPFFQDAMEFAAGATDAPASEDAKCYSFEDYVQMDPRIGELLRAAINADDDDFDRFCRHDAWYGYGAGPRDGGFRGKVVRLVGYERESDQACPRPLQTSAAYDVVYERILDALPTCRGKCGC